MAFQPHLSPRYVMNKFNSRLPMNSLTLFLATRSVSHRMRTLTPSPVNVRQTIYLRAGGSCDRKSSTASDRKDFIAADIKRATVWWIAKKGHVGIVR